jgi:hypothetical protein
MPEIASPISNTNRDSTNFEPLGESRSQVSHSPLTTRTMFVALG